jgi:hypothetical protein
MGESVLIDGVRYVRESQTSEIKILVLQRGWVVVGRVKKDGPQVIVTGGGVVRRWGTKQGLGELATKGPLTNTVIDPADVIETHELGIVCVFNCEVGKWSQHIR